MLGEEPAVKAAGSMVLREVLVASRLCVLYGFFLSLNPDLAHATSADTCRQTASDLYFCR